MNIIAIASGIYRRLFATDVDAIISTFLKAQDKLTALIERETAIMAQETAQMDALFQNRLTRNHIIDRAYRVIHKLDGLTA